MANTERTYIMIKPDGVQRGLVAEIISRWEKKGFILRALKMVTVDRAHAEKHYADLAGRPFFNGLIDYIISAPVVAMVWEGLNAVVVSRQMIGATKPWEATAGTVRGDFSIETGRNVIHGSDSVENANKEIDLWFPEGVNEWHPATKPWTSENP